MAHTRTRSRWPRLGDARPWGLLLSLAWGLALAAYAGPYVVDDAFIAAGYARRLAQGHGYAFQAGPATDGVTGPLWLLPLVVGDLLGLDGVRVGKLVGWVATALAVAIVHGYSAGWAGGRGRALLLGALLGSSAPLWVWAIGGLETGLAALLTALLLTGLARRPEPASGRVGLCAALLCWVRPELLPLSACAVAQLGLRSARGWKMAAWLGLLGLSSVLLFRRLCFGHWLPLSAHAKAPSLAHGVEYVLHCGWTPSALSLLPLLFAGVAWGRRDDRVLSLAVAVHTVAVTFAGGDWMAGARLFVPVVPFACYLAAQGALTLWRRRRAMTVALVLLGGLVRVPAAIVEVHAARTSGLLREERLPKLLAALADLPDPIALIDIGAIGYRGHRRVIDLGGLVEPTVAYAKGAHLSKHIDPAWLERQHPGVIVLHSRVRPRVDAAGRVRWFAGYPVERRVLSMPWVWRRYRVRTVVRYDRDYFYLVLVPVAPGLTLQSEQPVKAERRSVRSFARTLTSALAAAVVLAP